MLLLASCSSSEQASQQAAQAFETWTQSARAGARDEALCHGLGLIKHPAFTCADMLTYAAQVNPSSRQYSAWRARECVETVCGEFWATTTTAADRAGNPVDETVIVKQDDGRYRIYLYQSSSMVEAFRAAHPTEAEDGKDPLQAGYDALTNRFPSLYSYPPCHGITISSSKLQGALIAQDAIDPDAIDRLATNCPDRFCLGLVGRKIAPVCMDAVH